MTSPHPGSGLVVPANGPIAIPVAGGRSGTSAAPPRIFIDAVKANMLAGAHPAPPSSGTTTPTGFGSGIVPPHGTPVSTVDSPMSSLPYYTPFASYASAARRAQHFDPYPAAPAPTPASSFADNPGEYMPIGSFVQRQLAANPTDPFPPRTPTTPISAQAASAAMLTPAGPSYLGTSPLSPLAASLAAASLNSNAPSANRSIGVPPAIRPRRRSSLSIATTINNAAATSQSNNKAFLCDECGQVFKNPEVLSKHKWEHSEYWRETSKLELPKHQQVQLLEAAKILVSLEGAKAKPKALYSLENDGCPSGDSTVPASPDPLDTRDADGDDIMFAMQDDGPSATA